MPYVATINTPGYLPMDDDPPIFDEPRDAWSYLAEERRRSEENVDGDESELFSETVAELEAQTAVGAVYGPTPGYDGEHDLGLIYSVLLIEDGDDSFAAHCEGY